MVEAMAQAGHLFPNLERMRLELTAEGFERLVVAAPWLSKLSRLLLHRMKEASRDLAVRTLGIAETQIDFFHEGAWWR